MGTVAEKLTRLQQTKSDIKAAIVEKGQVVSDADPFSSYPAKIRAIETQAPESPFYPGITPNEVYKITRPKDWLQMPITEPNDVYLLVHIPNGGSEKLSLRISPMGSHCLIKMEYGSVISGNFSPVKEEILDPLGVSSFYFETELFSDDYGDLTTDGFKQVMIKITATANGEPTKVDCYLNKHSGNIGTDRENDKDWNIVEFAVNVSSFDPKIDVNAKTGLSRLKYAAEYGLTPSRDLTFDGYTDYYGCTSLITVLRMNYRCREKTFYNCKSLISIPEPVFYRWRGDEADGYSFLQSVESLFDGCNSLVTVPPFDFTDGPIKVRNMFKNCFSLQSVPWFDTSKVEDAYGLFYLCKSLIFIPEFDFSSVKQATMMFYKCESLVYIPKLDLRNSTTNPSTLYLSNSIQYIIGCSFKSTGNFPLQKKKVRYITYGPSIEGWEGQNLDLRNTLLSHAAIIDLFNSLPIVSGTKARLQLINTPGVSELTEEEKAIATDKGWVLAL